MFSIVLTVVLIVMVFSDRDRALYYYHKFGGTPASLKEHLTHQIIKQMRAGGIAPQDIAQAYNAVSAESIQEAKAGAMPRLFSILGGIFILAGVGSYIGMFWEDMPSAVRVIITLGLGLALSAFGIVAIRENRYPRIIVPVLVAAALMCTAGGFVYLAEYYPHSDNVAKATLAVFTFMTLHQLLMFKFFPRTLTVAMGIVFLYGALGSAMDLADISPRIMALVLGGSLLLVSQGLAKSPFSSLVPLCMLVAAGWFNSGIYDWVDELASEKVALIVTGASVFALGYGLALSAETGLTGFFYFVGTMLFFIGFFDLVDSTSYDILFLLVSMGMVYVSILLKSRAILLNSTFAILGFIGYYADRYFVKTLGLPIALILAGFIFIGIGAGALKIKKKYF